MAHKFEIYKDKAGEFRVRFKYNSETIFSTEGYSSKASAQNAIDSIKTNGPGAATASATLNPISRASPQRSRRHWRAGRRARCRGGRHGP